MSTEKSPEVGEKSPLLAAVSNQSGLVGNGLADAATQKALGKQTITSWGSFILNCNNLVGPALVTFPLVYQTEEKSKSPCFPDLCPFASNLFFQLKNRLFGILAGWFTPTLLLILMMVFTSFNASMLTEAMQRIPGNGNFQRRFEFATTMKHYWGRSGFVAGQILVNLCLQAGNIASIIVAAQVMDGLLIFITGHSWALRFVPPIGFITSSGDASSAHPFGHQEWILSLGYVVAMVICLPFGYLNLDENMGFQWFSFIGMTITLIEFIVQFFIMDWHPEYIPMWGNVSGAKSQALVLGTVIFSCAYAISIPSWVNEKKPKVNTNLAVWLPAVFSTIAKIAFGYLAAIVYRNEQHSDNILNVMSARAEGALGVVTRISIYAFNLSTIIPGIPVYSILVRYNLITGKICGPKIAFVLGVLAPWLVSMFFYHGRGLSSVVNWTAILVQGFVNFVFPCLLFFYAYRWYVLKQKPDQEKGIMPEEEDEASPTPTPDFSINPDNVEAVSGEEDPAPGNEEQDVPLDDEPEIVEQDPVNAIPSWIRVDPRCLALSIVVVMLLLVGATLGLDFYYLIALHEDIVDN